MRANRFLGVLLFLLVAGGVGLVSLHRGNVRLRAQATEERLRTERATRGDRGRLPAATLKPNPSAVAAGGGASPPAADAAEARLTQLRAEVAALEQKAAKEWAANPEASDAPSTNRDPEKGMTRLENFRDVGQSTPAAALQTLFWAILKGDEPVMARTIGWEEAVRPQAEALIASLPKELRARFSTPEQLAALFIAKYALDVSAIHISATTFANASNATLTVKGLTGGDQSIPMHLGPGGWQIQATAGTLRALSQDLLGKQ